MQLLFGRLVRKLQSEGTQGEKMDTFFYCQGCNAKITLDQLALLNGGRCPACGSMEGFSTMPKDAADPFDSVTVINDAELLEKSFSGSGE